MPPKPRPAYKAATSNATPASEIGGSHSGDKADKPSGSSKTAMEPPPAPAKPMVILEPEINAMHEALNNAAIKIGQILRFYSDTQRLGISRHTSHPPRTLTSALAYEMDRYNQICDGMEAVVVRSITALKRELSKEEARIEEEERLARLARERVPSPVSTRASISEADGSTSSPQITPKSLAKQGPLSLAQNRRQSKISMLALRAPAPLKLDLSAASLRGMNPEEAMALSGLASPVTLAPKSARPMAGGDIPPELYAALASASAQQVDMDLTLGEPSHLNLPGPLDTSTIGTLGNSAEKPIELDLDMDVDMNLNIFGDAPQNSPGTGHVNMDGLFGPPSGQQQASTSQANNGLAQGSAVDASLFEALANVNQANQDDAALFASLQSNAMGAQSSAALNLPAPPAQTDSGPANGPSPNTFMASLVAAENNANIAAGSEPGGLQTGDGAFDFNQLQDMSNFSGDFFAQNANPGENLDIQGVMSELLNLDAPAGPSNVTVAKPTGDNL